VRTLRLPSAFVLALAFTSTLFSGLWLVISKSVDVGEVQRATKIEFTRLKRDTDVKTRAKRQKVQLEKPAQVQSAPQIAIDMGVGDRGGPAIDILPPTVGASGAALSGLSFGGGGGGRGGGIGAAADRDVVPLVRIEPDYPTRAAQRGIEGYAVVQFAITPAGTVKDAIVIDAEPDGVFDSAAVAAVSRWKYNPKMEGGVAVERRGIRVKLAFKLEK
jgi:periplasmic protein TonB